MASTTTGHGSWSLWDDVSIITGDQVQAFTGAAAFSQVTPPLGIPDSSQVTRVTLDLVVSTDGSAAPGQNVAPLIQFGLTSDNENGHVFARYTLGASPHTELPLDTAQHALRYDTDIDFWGSGGPAGFAADVLNGADPLVMYVGGQQLSSGGYIIYYTGMVFTFYWEGVDTPSTAPPPLRLTNRDDQFASARRMVPSSRSRQGSNRMTGYL